MKIRPYKIEDEARVRELHQASGFDYPLPDFSSSEFAEVMVVADEDDRLVQLVAARKTVEIYFIGDPHWRTPAWRLDAIRGLHNMMQSVLILLGYREATAYLAPQVAKAFGRRLREMDWVQGKWKHFTKHF